MAHYNLEEANLKAERILTKAYKSHMSGIGSIFNYRRVIRAGIPAASDELERQDEEQILEMLKR